MRSIFFITLALCFSACLSQRFLQYGGVPGGFQQINLYCPPYNFLLALDFVDQHFYQACNVNANLRVTGIKRAASQVVAGTNYEIVFTVRNYSSRTVSVRVFQSLPNEAGVVSYQITSCY